MTRNRTAQVSVDRLNHLLSYDPLTGTLTWRVTKRGTKADKEAGHHRADGYRLICIDGVIMLAHRIAWAMHYGAWPDSDLDHRNGKPGDDRIDNLRQCTHQQNQWNRKMQSNNTSGVVGVSWSKQKGKWVAKIGPRAVGFFDDIEKAAVAREHAVRRAYGEFARVG